MPVFNFASPKTPSTVAELNAWLLNKGMNERMLDSHK